MSRARLLAIVWLAIVCLALAPACGSTPDTQSTTAPSGTEELLTSSPGDRLVVATVNGIPVYDDCVAHQAAALAAERSATAEPATLRRQALEECVDFELLAQAAQHRGFLADPDVQEARTRETVRRLIDVEVRSTLPSVDQLDPKLLQDTYAKLKPRIHRPELRDVAHFIVTAKNEPEGSPKDRAAKALAEQIYAAMAQTPSFTADAFFRRAKELAPEDRLGPKGPDGKFRIEEFKLSPTYPGIPQHFTDALFSIPEIGKIAPPVRTREGWHILLLTAIVPAVNATPEEARELVFGFLQNQRYEAAAGPLMKAANIQVDEQALARLQAAEEASRFGAPRSP